MAKRKKKKKQTTASQSLTPGGAVKAQLRAFNWRLAIFIIISTIAAFALFEALIAVPSLRVGGIPVVYPVYYLIATVLVCIVIILNHGFSVRDVTPDMFDDEGDRERVKLACEAINRQKKLAKKFMLALLPFLFSIFFDIIVLFYGDFFAGAFDYWFGQG